MATQETLKKGSEQFIENPFGAVLLPEGGVRFRLWAPAAKNVEVAFEDEFQPMQRRQDGWYELINRSRGAGTLYQYRIDGSHLVPDPASRFQPMDCEGPSQVVETGFRFSDWKTPAWNEAVIYELHVGTFTPEGTYAGVASKLEHLKRAGITAVELMPLSDFSGKRNWGYDGVLPFAPDSAYGRPEDLKALVQACHDAGLMIFLDVVYNHFGPKGNYLSLYAPQFFTERHKTPWGAAIDFRRPQVRQFFIQNVRYWLEEYRFDGLRFDAVHAIVDDSPVHILDEIRASAPAGKHLILENDANQAHFLKTYTAQWNDDAHHGFHVLATGERDGYYVSYADAPAKHLARCLAEGFAYQGERSPFSGEPRGEPSAHLPPSCFVNFLQNHDQIGNRAFGERLISLADEKALRALVAIQLLSPSPPLLFMGEEWGCRQPFLFFCDFDGELGEAVRKGRREEFKRFSSFGKDIPDPLSEQTFRQCVLRWEDVDETWVAYYRELLDLRRREIAPVKFGPGAYQMLDEQAFEVSWGELLLLANCSAEQTSMKKSARKVLWSNGEPGEPWSVNWFKR